MGAETNGTTGSEVVRELTLPELLEQALEALTDFITSRQDLTGCERVEDANVLIYDALALVDPITAIDRDELRGLIDTDTAITLRRIRRAQP